MQECRLLGMPAKTAGQMFHATGGRHLNLDEFFKARALSEREARTKELSALKTKCNAAVELEGAVVTALLQRREIPVRKMQEPSRCRSSSCF
jgi:hypothetical protein